MTKETIQEIAKQTDLNGHTMALITLARAMGGDGHLKTLENIDAIHRNIGHMPYHLGLFRTDISYQLRQIAKGLYDEETYNQICGAL
jgi:hypothetical protein